MKRLLGRNKKVSVVDAEIKEVKREWRNLLKFNDENRLLFAAFVVVLCSLLVVNAVFAVNMFTTRNVKPVENNVGTANQSNQFVTSHNEAGNGVLKAKISNVTQNDEKDPAFTIDPAETMLIMDIEITNTSNLAHELMPSIQFYARSNEGDYAQLHASIFVTNPLPAKELAPGESVSGQISFNVPKRVAMPLVYIDTGWENYGPVIFDALH